MPYSLKTGALAVAVFEFMQLFIHLSGTHTVAEVHGSATSLETFCSFHLSFVTKSRKLLKAFDKAEANLPDALERIGVAALRNVKIKRCLVYL